MPDILLFEDEADASIKKDMPPFRQISETVKTCRLGGGIILSEEHIFKVYISRETNKKVTKMIIFFSFSLYPIRYIIVCNISYVVKYMKNIKVILSTILILIINLFVGCSNINEKKEEKLDLFYDFRHESFERSLHVTDRSEIAAYCRGAKGAGKYYENRYQHENYGSHR